jgi:hypothetical protein
MTVDGGRRFGEPEDRRAEGRRTEDRRQRADAGGQVSDAYAFARGPRF